MSAADLFIWLPIDDRARDGTAWLCRCIGDELIVAFWEAGRFVHPGTAGKPVVPAPYAYNDPALRLADSRHG